jgi:hypothetical protein
MVELKDAEDTSEEDMSEESEEESLKRSTDQLLNQLSKTEVELERSITESKFIKINSSKLLQFKKDTSDIDFSNTESSRVEADTSLTTPEDAEEESHGTKLKSLSSQLKRLSMKKILDNTMAKSEDAEATGEDHL